ncbi:putative bifunctional diguanylate cyclase/phosphodiesterase [Inhella proteolytica]|uniref:EAL domain-containing protein n=1 Tax=Inhella proteolytica TaxID=2795029 RepID=A0A931J1G8_9BURK|nr:sensor domain-containing phosphodiesterase [Inhella proteolytica]MBH9576983.1 EAL domain-containing protein [Inhella proteolytica]
MSARETLHREVGLAWVGADGQLLSFNATLRGWLGEARPERLEQLLPVLTPARWARWKAEGFADVLSLELGAPGGEPLVVQVQADPAPDGLCMLSLLGSLPAAERLAIDALQRAVLGAVASGEPLRAVMDLLCREVEALAPELMCSVLAVDAQGHVHPLAGPSLPVAYTQALEGLPIGPVAGSCGTAAWRREPVDVRSIATDPLWAPYRDLALSFGLAACWSTPVLTDVERRVGATFALYYREEAPVADSHRHLVQACSQMVRVALLHDERERRIQQLAYGDDITGLPNRARFTQRAEALLQVQAAAGTGGALLLMDLDRFKAVNELQGHAVGNEVLRRIGARLAQALPGLDTLARLGDDEFVVLLPGADRAAAEREALRLCALAAEPLVLERGQQLRLGLSVGFSLFPQDGHTLDALLKHADIALNAAKLSGRNTARGFSAEQAQALQEKAWMEGELREALARGGFVLHFQPQCSLQDGRVLGAEVLLRWPHPQRGLIPPDRFIPVAEECGLIVALDAWVLDAALRQLARWHAQGLALPSLAVNLSPPRLLHGDLQDQVLRLLAQTGLPPSALTLEVTERLMLDERQDRRAVEPLSQLRALGVGVSIDDFGTGYSCLGYLRRLPISELKIDRSFVHELAERPEDRALVAAMVTMARGCRLQLVAEGVETEAQAQVLRELGCDAYQGYGLARPMPAAELEAWLRGRL